MIRFSTGTDVALWANRTLLIVHFYLRLAHDALIHNASGGLQDFRHGPSFLIEKWSVSVADSRSDQLSG